MYHCLVYAQTPEETLAGFAYIKGWLSEDLLYIIIDILHGFGGYGIAEQIITCAHGLPI